MLILDSVCINSDVCSTLLSTLLSTLSTLLLSTLSIDIVTSLSRLFNSSITPSNNILFFLHNSVNHRLSSFGISGSSRSIYCISRSIQYIKSLSCLRSACVLRNSASIDLYKTIYFANWSLAMRFILSYLRLSLILNRINTITDIANNECDSFSLLHNSCLFAKFSIKINIGIKPDNK